MIRVLLATTAAMGFACVGCQKPTARLNAPPHGVPEETNDMQGTFVYMTDNALLADMTVSDRHFMPHRAMLNSLGTQRLARLVSLMDAYGGTIRFNSSVEDDLKHQRMDTVRQFLADAGVDTSKEVLVEDLPGGSGMDAKEALLIKANEGTYDPDKRGSSSASGTTIGIP